jgi:twitching motility protein PilT
MEKSIQKHYGAAVLKKGAPVVKKFNDLILAAVKEGFSDLHITGNQPFVFRNNGAIHTDKAIRWTYPEIDDLVKGLLSPVHLQTLRSRWSVDFAFTVQHVRIRMNIFNTVRGLSLAIRLLPGTVPTIEMLNLHPSLQKIGEIKTGLVLICGTTGCGKTTTIAAILEEINRSRFAHIVTIEDPVEYRFISKQSFIQQREVGTHVPTFRQGLLDVLREDPDVIVVGELREPETIRLTINAAESGHLVIASIHAAQAEDAIYRICNSFPLEAQEEIRFQFASALSWVVIQQLLYIERLRFRVPLLSILRGTQAVKGIIRDNRLPQIENAMHTGKKDGMFTRDRYLDEFLNPRETFVLPSQSFRPTPESLPDEGYTSSLIAGDFNNGLNNDRSNGHSIPDVPPQIKRREAAVDKLSSPKIVFQAGSVAEPHSIIDDKENLEDLIAQLDKAVIIPE